jgi:4'-phosphopantetheinyl transferase EntD
MGLVDRILAPGICGAEMEDAGLLVTLHPDEEVFVAKAAAKRRRDFALGRCCGRAALAQLGQPGAAIGIGEGGAPLWPAGIVGSITHTAGYAAALVADARRFGGIGVDAERVGGVTQDLWPRLFDTVEHDFLTGLENESRAVIATLLFSAKESAYKAWRMKGALAFRDIRITPEADGFTAAKMGEVLRGRYAVAGALMLTAAWIPL